MLFYCLLLLNDETNNTDMCNPLLSSGGAICMFLCGLRMTTSMVHCKLSFGLSIGSKIQVRFYVQVVTKNSPSLMLS